MKTYKEKLLFRILLTLLFLIILGCELYMSVIIDEPGEVLYEETSAIKYEDSNDIISLKYNYKNEFDTTVKYDNTYKVVGVLSSYDSDNRLVFENSYDYISSTTNVGDGKVVELDLDNLDINYQEVKDQLDEAGYNTGKLTVYYYLNITASSNKLNNKILLDNKDNIVININQDGYTINDKDSSTNNKMTIRDVGTKMNFNGIHLIYAIIALGAFIILLVKLIKFINHHKEVTTSFNNKIKRVTKGYEDVITKGNEMKYPKKVTYKELDDFEELVKVSKKAKDNIMEYMTENEAIYAVRLEDDVYQYIIKKEE